MQRMFYLQRPRPLQTMEIRSGYPAGRAIEPRPTSGPGHGRPYRPPLRKNRRRVRRGGFHIRPCRSTLAEHTRRRGAHRASVAGNVVCQVGWKSTLVPGGYIIRPYNRVEIRSGRWTVLHTEASGTMWASAPTKRGRSRYPPGDLTPPRAGLRGRVPLPPGGPGRGPASAATVPW